MKDKIVDVFLVSVLIVAVFGYIAIQVDLGNASDTATSTTTRPVLPTATLTATQTLTSVPSMTFTASPSPTATATPIFTLTMNAAIATPPSATSETP